MTNNGKRFEQDFKKSVPKGVWYYRFKDGTASWDNGNATRFQQQNICDCMLVQHGQLTLCELKSSKGISLPFNNIRQSQIDQMIEASQYGINALFIIKLDNNVFAIDVESVDDYIRNAQRKSIPISWLEENGIHVPCEKLKVNYRYDLGVIL